MLRRLLAVTGAFLLTGLAPARGEYERIGEFDSREIANISIEIEDVLQISPTKVEFVSTLRNVSNVTVCVAGPLDSVLSAIPFRMEDRAWLRTDFGLRTSKLGGSSVDVVVQSLVPGTSEVLKANLDSEYLDYFTATDGSFAGFFVETTSLKTRIEVIVFSCELKLEGNTFPVPNYRIISNISEPFILSPKTHP